MPWSQDLLFLKLRTILKVSQVFELRGLIEVSLCSVFTVRSTLVVTAHGAEEL